MTDIPPGAPPPLRVAEGQGILRWSMVNATSALSPRRSRSHPPCGLAVSAKRFHLVSGREQRGWGKGEFTGGEGYYSVMDDSVLIVLWV